MRAYTGDYVIEHVDSRYAGFATSPDEVPTKPSEKAYLSGVHVLETLRASDWNYFMRLMVVNIRSAAVRVQDIMAELQSVLDKAGIVNDPMVTSQLLQSIEAIIGAGLLEVRSEIDALYARIKDRISDLDTRVKDDLAALGTRAGDLEAALSALAARVGTAESDVAMLGAKAGDLEADLSALAARVGAVESDLAPLTAGVAAIEAWKAGLAASSFGITGKWTCPTPALP